jgi:hypothetical protein
MNQEYALATRLAGTVEGAVGAPTPTRSVIGPLTTSPAPAPSVRSLSLGPITIHVAPTSSSSAVTMDPRDAAYQIQQQLVRLLNNEAFR